jgi:putative addiction module component (TIGR02574 family)
MNSALCDEIVKLDAATRFQLAQDLLDSVASELRATPLSPEHCAELQDRLAHRNAHPDEPTLTLAEIKSKAGIE